MFPNVAWLIRATHGRRTVAEAYDLLYYPERTAQVQIYAMWTGRPLKVLPQDVIDKTIAEFKSGRTYGGRDPAAWHFDALKPMLDRTEPDYRN